MNSTQFSEFAKVAERIAAVVIAQSEVLQYLEQQVSAIAPELKYVRTPQRKARYNDKQRIRFKDAKLWALRRSGCSDTIEVKKYLKVLGKKLDLRLTSAWIAVNLEFADAIKSLKEEAKWSVGDHVEWIGYKPMQAYICQWFPLSIVAIKNGKALLELWSEPVPLDELIAAG